MMKTRVVYTESELSMIQDAGLETWGDPAQHPRLQLGTRIFRPVIFPDEIRKLNLEAGSNRCNLRCQFCFQSPDYEFSRRRETFMRMPLETAKSIIRSLPNLDTFVPYSINEPGMEPDNMPELLAYVWRERRAKTYISTNLSLPWRNYRDWIASAGIEKIILGAGGITKAVHEFHRPGSDWDLFLANIERLVDLRARTGWPKIIEYQVIITSRNEHELEDTVDFASKLGLQAVQFKTLALKTAASVELLPEKATLRRDQSREMSSPCAYAFEALTIVLSDHGGAAKPGPKVALCVCGYFSPADAVKYIRGNLNGDLGEHDLFLAMNDPALQSARIAQLRSGARSLPVCLSCPSYKPLSADYMRGGTLDVVRIEA